MGNGPSKSQKPTNNAAELEKRKLALTQNLVSDDLMTKVGEFNQVISKFQDNKLNDLNELIQIANKSVNLKMSEQTKSQIENIIKNENFGLINETQDPYNFIKEREDADVLKLKEGIRSDPILVQNPTLTKQVEHLLGSVSSLRMSYKYYLYKYLQTNLLLFTFTQAMMEISNKYADDITAFSLARIELYKESLGAFIDTAVDIIKPETSINEHKDILAVSNSVKDLLQKTSEDWKQKMEHYKTANYKDIVQYLLTTQQELAQLAAKPPTQTQPSQMPTY